VTQYISNHTPTKDTTGWSAPGSPSIQATADGIRWYDTGSGSGRTLRVKVTNIDNWPFGSVMYTYLTAAGVQIRRNTATSGNLKQIGFKHTAEDESEDWPALWGPASMATVPLTQSLWTTLPNQQAQIAASYNDDDPVYYVFEAQDGKPFDFTLKNVKVYDSDIPANMVLDASDAVFTYTQPNDSLSGTFTFAGGNNEAVASVVWDFGDGSATVTKPANASAVTHAFPTAGIYTVKMTAYSPQETGLGMYGSGWSNFSSTQVVTVPVGEFTAKFTYQVDFPVLTVDASSSVAPIRGPVQTYAWNWGDGKVDQGVRQSHEYAAAGSYTVTLTTSNSITKATSTATKVIVIGQASAQIGAAVYEMALYLDDPGSTVGATNLQAEMVPIIRATEIKHNWTRGEKPTMTFTAPSSWLVDALGAGTTLENLRSDVVVRFNYGAGWVEPPMCRFIVSGATADALNPRTAVQVTCYLAASADMDGVFFTPEMINRAYSTNEIKANYARLFTASTAGAIGRSLLPVATTPGSGGTLLPYLNVDFSPTVDSKGVAWATTLSTLTVPPEANGSGLQDLLVQNGAIDWYAQGNVIRWFNRGTCGKRAGDDAIPALLPGVDVKGAPQTRAIASQAWGAVVVSGTKPPFIAVDTDATSESYSSAHYRGRRYVAIQSQDADSDAAALAIARPTLTQIKRARDGQMQRELIFYPGMPWAPYRDYWVGDVITAPGPNGTMITTTVEGITISKTSADGMSASLTLGKAFPIDPLASKVASLSGGGGISVGTVGERPPSATSGFIETLVSKKITSDSGTVNAGQTSGLQLEGKTTGGTALVELNSDSTSAFVRSMTIYSRTYSSSANVYITSSGTIGRSTSASKYKLNIEEADYGTAVLDLPMKTWFDRSSCENFLSTEDADVSRQVGLIAEDLVDAGLGEFVVHNWETGEVEGIQYDRVALLLIPIVRDLRDQLEARDSVLESVLARLDSLEGNSMTDNSEQG
jgi:PKD repeat protein